LNIGLHSIRGAVQILDTLSTILRRDGRYLKMDEGMDEGILLPYVHQV
jgi:hypothetical protein